MYPAEIESYVRPQTVAEALAAISKYEDGEGMFLAGGQSLMQAIKSRMLRPRCIVDLQSVAELKGIRYAEGLTIGAMTRYADIAADQGLSGAYAGLRDAARHIGDRQVRNRGTIGGSVCWNYVASCLPTVVLGLGGTLNMASVNGSTRQIDADDFFLGPFETARESDEILVSISWPAAPAHSGSAYKKWGLVTDAVPVVGVCILVTLDAGGVCTSARMALAGLSDGAQRAPAGEQALIGSSGDAASVEKALEAVIESVETQSDHWADSNYREQLIRTIGREVIATAFDRARA
jgi:carbon-monoxide dehydrogenase medium subunit